MMLLAIFQYDFMVRAFLAGILIAVIAPVIGSFLVVKRYSLLADTLSHVSLLGVALGVLLGVDPILGAIVVSVITAYSIEWLRVEKKLYGESILALFLTGGLSTALVILGFTNGLNVNLLSFLFGSITTVTTSDLVTISIAGAVVLLTVILLFRRLFLVAYDETLAAASGLSARWINIILILLAAVTVAISIRIVGALLVGALMVIPVLSATQFGLGFRQTTVLSVVVSLLAVIFGLVISFFVGLPSGATIVVVALVLFGGSVLVNSR